ncbi:hypothetical protein UFOVP421_11 [uncultured Caudovirales phage]|uniref:Uncharacterized protein n=1 Tax=uncultured Caudovirales phage TaxID=2100421 RepID=A0A6J5M721_9CAUD|nr:hypothetical protein UFOVP421_11 [uncultured Caudovirales phage]
MTPDRTQRLNAAAVALADGARRAAEQGELTRAMRLLAVADAVRKAARGDRLGRKLALNDARVLRRAALRGGAA